MDGRQFDEFARLLARGKTRREAIKTFLAGAVAVAGLNSAKNVSAGGCFGFDVVCSGDGDCCSGSCESFTCTCVGPGSVCYSVDDCCSDMLCVSGIRQGNDACVFCGESADCSDDSDCCNGLTCISGACGTAPACDETTPCDGECCEGYVCNQETFFCELASTCGEGESGSCVNYDSECCDGYYCVGQQCIEIPVCAPLYCSSIVSCCDNKVCLDGGGNHNDGDFSGGSCYVRVGQLCDSNGDQGCEVGECIDGYCGGAPECVAEGLACDSDRVCCGDLVCTEGMCAVAEPDDGDGDGGGEEPANGESGGEDDGGYVAPVALPNTGSGSDTNALTVSLLTTGLTAGAAALLIGQKLRSAAKADEHKINE